jgi:hypothetical protein
MRLSVALPHSWGLLALQAFVIRVPIGVSFDKQPIFLCDIFDDRTTCSLVANFIFCLKSSVLTPIADFTPSN